MSGNSTSVGILINAKDNASRTIEGIGLSLGKVTKAATMATAAIGATGAALGGIAVKEAIAFEKSMGNLETLIGSGTQASQEFNNGIKDILKTVPKSAEDLGSSAYAVVSAGISDSSEALGVLENSAKLAVSGLGETSEATDLMTSAINAFQLDANDADKIANTLFLTVKNGKTTVSQLAQSFGMVAPLANEMGVKFDDLQAATAALTTSGLQTSVAQTQIRAALQSLLKPTAEMKTAFEKLGVASGKELLANSENMVQAFADIKDSFEGNDEAAAKAFGSVEGLNAVLSLTGATADSYATSLTSMKTQSDAMSEAFDVQKNKVWALWGIMKNNFTVELMKIGEVALPYLAEAMKKVIPFTQNLAESVFETAGQIKNLFERAKELWEKFQDTSIFKMTSSALKLIGDVIKEVLFPAFAEVKQTIVDNKAELTLLAKVLGTILYVALHVVVGVITTLILAFTQVLKIILKVIDLGIKALAFQINWLKGIFQIFTGNWSGGWESIKAAMKDAYDFIVDLITSLWQPFNDFLGLLGKIWSKITSIGSSEVKGSSVSVDDAVISPSGQVITTNPRDYLIATQNPAGMVAGLGGGGGGITVNFNNSQFLRGREVAEEIGDEIINVLRRDTKIS